MVFSVGEAHEVSDGVCAGSWGAEHLPLSSVLQITAVMLTRMMVTEWDSRPGGIQVLDSKCVCFMGVRWPWAMAHSVISDTRPVKHCPLPCSSPPMAALWTIVLTVGNHVLSNVRDIFARQRKLAVCLCVVKHGQRVVRSDPASWPSLLVTVYQESSGGHRVLPS